jgi:hypothetical protein
MPDYSKVKIFKLISPSTDKICIGSTLSASLNAALATMRQTYRRYLNESKGNYLNHFDLVKYPDCKIILIENVNCNNKDEMIQNEYKHIDFNLNCSASGCPIEFNKLTLNENKTVKEELEEEGEEEEEEEEEVVYVKKPKYKPPIIQEPPLIPYRKPTIFFY